MVTTKIVGRSFLTVCLSFIFALFAFDFAAYFLAPDSLVRFAHQYRASIPSYNSSDLGFTSKGYFKQDHVLGFDIQDNRPATEFNFADGRFSVSSNDLGCRDANRLNRIRGSESYDYFAGDSFTWGFVNYESIFPRVYEINSGRISLKCGVSASGQIHQFQKFKNIIDIVGTYPKHVFVGYYFNDPSDDYSHPHSTVIDDVKIKTVVIDKYKNIKRLDYETLKKTIELSKVREKSEKQVKTPNIIIQEIKRVSLSANLINYFVKNYTSKSLSQFQGTDVIQNSISFGESYSVNRFTKPNRDAIETWGIHANNHEYELVFVLIPPAPRYADSDLYRGLKTHLEKNKIKFLDLTDFFLKAELLASDIYWHYDGHLNVKGNEIVGNALVEYVANN